MNGINKQYLIDSNIIIYHLNGVEIATNFLKENIDTKVHIKINKNKPLK